MSGLLQFLMFCLLAGASLTIFAVVLLLPDCANYEKAQYQLAKKQVTVTTKQALIEGYKRFGSELPHNVVLTKRLVMNEFGYWPEDEVVVLTDKGPRQHSPANVVVPKQPEPTPPTGWVMSAALKVADPPTRRGLLLMTAAGLAAAVLLFPGGKTSRRKKAAANYSAAS